MDPKPHVQLNHQGIILAQNGQYSLALKALTASLKLAPNQTSTLNNIGMIYSHLGNHQLAIEAYLKALKLAPNLLEVHFNLANIYHINRQNEQAILHYLQALKLKPDFIMAQNNLGNVYQEMGQVGQAIESYQRALKIKPDFILALNNLGLALRNHGQMDAAIKTYQKAIQLKPASELYNGLAISLMESGQVKKALQFFEKAIQLKSNNWEAWMNYLLCLTYQPHLSEETIFKHCLQWGEKMEHSFPLMPTIDINQLKSNNRLRIGYVSPDFREHSAQYLIKGLLQYHSKHQFEIFCYADVKQADPVTMELKGLAENWRNTSHLNHQQLVQLITQDKIQILIDLAGHTANNRLSIFASKPAPIQVTYYPMSTGLTTIDYRIADAYMITEKNQDLNTENLLYLSGGYMCFTPPKKSLQVSSPPSIKKGYVTFGSFNTLAKINLHVISIWSEILKAVPDAHIFLKYKAFKDPTVKAFYFQEFRKHGIKANRIKLMAWVASEQHLELYNQIDIALDPFPFNGHITTCEALWMGVPVITLAGPRDFNRSGVSILSRIGISELIAYQTDTYIKKAIQLAQDIEKRTDLRKHLRKKLSDSSFCQVDEYVSDLEKKYLEIWKKMLPDLKKRGEDS